MLTLQPSVGVAFLRGDPRRLWDRVIMGSTQGPFVHTEFFIQNGSDIRMYTATNLTALQDGTQQARGGFTPSARVHSLENNPQWETIRFPVSHQCYSITYALILQLLALNLPYNSRDLWQCCFKLMLPFEQDLDCHKLDTWRHSGVFCSQVCLLLLRRLHAQGLLMLRPGVAKDVTETNSRGCSPNSLYHILKGM